jgi:hypothetical protein
VTAREADAVPFTPSHAIVALPFARTPLPAGAVAIGAMAPDLPLFFPTGPSYAATHGFPSLLWVSLPLAIALYLVWRLAIRPAASGLLPVRAWRSRMPAAWDAGRLGLRELPWIVVACLLGVATHVLWDLFTHPGRLGLAALDAERGPFSAATWLQHLSSALGLIGLAVWAIVAGRRAVVVPRIDGRGVPAVRVTAWIVAGAALVGSFVAVWSRDGLPTGYRSLADTSFDAGTSAGAAILVVALTAALAVRVVRALRRD